MDAWVQILIAILGMIITIVGSFAVVKTILKRSVEDIKESNGHIESLFKLSDMQGKEIIALKTEKAQYLTSKEMDDVYLRRKEFEQFEKHIDTRFDDLKNGQAQILAKISEL